MYSQGFHYVPFFPLAWLQPVATEMRPGNLGKFAPAPDETGQVRQDAVDPRPECEGADPTLWAPRARRLAASPSSQTSQLSMAKLIYSAITSLIKIQPAHLGK